MLYQNSLSLERKLLGWGACWDLCGCTCHGTDGEPGLTWPLWGSEEEPPSGATDRLGISHNRTTERSAPAGCV